jgi:hypothetical protein
LSLAAERRGNEATGQATVTRALGERRRARAGNLRGVHEARRNAPGRCASLPSFARVE